MVIAPVIPMRGSIQLHENLGVAHSQIGGLSDIGKW